MDEELECSMNVFSTKFDRFLGFLLSSRGETFTDGISFLLEKALDHLKVANNSFAVKDAYSVFQTATIKRFFSETLDVTTSSVNLPILVFSISVLSELSSNQQRFQKSYSESPEAFLYIQKITSSELIEKTEVKSTLMHFFLSLSKSHEGREWIWSCGLLRFTTQCLEDPAVYIRKPAKELTHTLLMSSTDDQRKEIFERLLILMKKWTIVSKSQQNQNDFLEIYLIVLESYIERNLVENRTNYSGRELVSLGIEDLLMDLAQNSSNQKFLGQICSLMAGIYAKCAYESATEISSWKSKTLEIIQLVLSKDLAQVTLNVVSKSLFFWSYIDHKEFQLNLIHIMVVPLFIETEESSEKYQQLTQYWKNCVSNEILDISNRLTTILQNHPDLNKITTTVLAGLTKSMKKIRKDISLKIISSSLYLLECLSFSGCKRVDQFYSLPQMVTSLTETLCSLMDFCHIYWWDCDQSPSFPVVLKMLTTRFASQNIQITCTGLEAMKSCLNQLIHADGNVIPDYPMENLVSAIHYSSVSIHWEIRDSALELILLMAKLSHSCYSGFRQLLLRSKLLEASVSATNDSEAYVRASALNVIAESAASDLLWQKINSETDVTRRCYMLLKDSEALVRRAAAKALPMIAQGGNLRTDEDRNMLHRYMSHAALSDLDWEVKLVAMEFWENVIQEGFNQEGIAESWSLPEDEPNLPQSKRRKLSETEKQLSIRRVLSYLGSCGCLHVLLKSIDDFDTPVRKKSLGLLVRLRQLLVIDDTEVSPKVVPELQPDSSVASTPSDASDGIGAMVDITDADRVIDEILSVDDTCLVKNILAKTEPDLMGTPVAVTEMEVKDFLLGIMILELDSMMKSTAVSSDLHVSNLDSLIEDIQTSIYTDSLKPGPDCY